MRKGRTTLLLGAVISLAGMSCLFMEEQAVARHRLSQAMGWAVFSFGLAHILRGGLDAVRSR